MFTDIISFHAVNRLTCNPYVTSLGMSFIWSRLLAFVIYFIFRFWKGGRLYPADTLLILLMAVLGLESLPVVFLLYFVFRCLGWIRRESVGGSFWERVNYPAGKEAEESKGARDNAPAPEREHKAESGNEKGSR